MKKQLLTSVFLFIVLAVSAQNVGIGTTSPNASALLDLSSSTKGLLLPRLTTSQMFGIQNPASGLMVFNSNQNELYHYNGTTWRPILNGSYWQRPINTRDAISNTIDSIGIGVSLPTKLLDVDGTVRIRGVLTMDAAIDATSVVVGSALIANQSVFQNTMTVQNDIVMTNTASIIQLKAGTVDKAFMQLNGDDLRVGTNSSNDDGKFVIRTNGADRVSVDASGNLNISGRIISDNTGPASLTPLCWGVTSTSSAGGIARGTSNIVSVVRLAVGQYRITCPGISDFSCVCINSRATGIITGCLPNNGYADVYVRKSDTNESFDQVFSFIIY